MRDTKGIEFRPKTDVPTEPGWYYGRYLYDGPHSDIVTDIMPMKVHQGFLQKGLVVMFPAKVNSVKFFDWFGPVREVREASCL